MNPGLPDENPFDVIPTVDESFEASWRKRRSGDRSVPPKSSPAKQTAKQQIAVHLPSDLVEELRDLAWHTRTPLTRVVAAALTDYMADWTRVHGHIPPRGGDLPTKLPKER